MNKELIAKRFKSLQEEICLGIEEIDGKAKFQSDNWSRADGGGGRTDVLSGGSILEKGGVAFSEVHGDVTSEMKKQLNFDHGEKFYATGISIVIHPHSPHVPIIHMNVRYFQMDEDTYWFGGGIDLTPHYIVREHAASFHGRLKTICDLFDTDFYPQFKQQADHYFYLPHRQETRGIGGIFYDHLSEENTSLKKEELFHLAEKLAGEFVSIYSEQVEFGKNKECSKQNIAWRNIRRGRYVEFNLVHDRGTKFGLHSGGRTESILMILPPRAEWEYNFHPEAGSLEAETISLLKKDIIWHQS